MELHAFIFCWPGQIASAKHIQASLRPQVERLTVLDSATETVQSQPSADWIKLDPDHYYGLAFRAALQRFEGDVLLQIQADAVAADWPKLAARCRAQHASQEQLGIWSPEIDHTDWPTPLVRLFDVAHSSLKAVALTDCTVWSLGRCVVKFLQSLDYAKNNLGWGIDVVAAAYCYGNQMIAVRDDGIQVTHRRGTGYGRAEADRQMREFISQLPFDLQRQVAILYRAISLNRRRLRQESAGP